MTPFEKDREQACTEMKDSRKDHKQSVACAASYRYDRWRPARGKLEYGRAHTAVPIACSRIAMRCELSGGADVARNIRVLVGTRPAGT